MDVTEAYFMELCEKELSLSVAKCNEALKFFKKTKHILSGYQNNFGSGAEEAERFRFAFVLYSVKKLNVTTDAGGESLPVENGFNLCDILRILKLKIDGFFKELPQFLVKAGPLIGEVYGADWGNRLQAKELQENFVQLSLLSKFYKRGYEDFFFTDEAYAQKNRDAENSATFLSSDCYRFGWLLFLALRNHELSRFKDIVTCSNGLVSILAILIIHVPCRFRCFSIQESSYFGDKGVDLLASLGDIYGASEDELRITMEKANNLIKTILKKKPSSASECQIDKLEKIDPDGLTYFDDLLDETSISCTLSALERNYKSDLDERMFINQEDSLARKIDLLCSASTTVTNPLSSHAKTNANKFAAVRINGMVEKLQVPRQMRESVYCLFQNILDQRVSLFFNRHIDQIILCCFYGVAKISRMNLTFREILYKYRKQPHCNQQVYRRVFVESRRAGEMGPYHVDIITFYNQVFVPAVRPLLLRLRPMISDLS